MKAWIVVDRNGFPCGYPFALSSAQTLYATLEKDDRSLCHHRIIEVDLPDEEWNGETWVPTPK